MDETMEHATDSDAGAMAFFDHVRELRRRLIVSMLCLGVGFVVAYLLHDRYIHWLLNPIGEQVYITSIEEGFMMKLRVSAYVGLILSFPVHVYNVVAFVTPALTGRERSFLRAMLAGSMALLLIGGYLAYFQILPLSFQFLKNPAFVPEGAGTLLGYQKNLLFALRLLFAFIILFQLPLVMILLMAMNLVDRRQMLKCSRYIIVLIFVLSALLTPPDPVSQIGLALPLIILFYLSILAARIFRFGEPD
jgi:sec-independent protein translocase protein TatC